MYNQELKERFIQERNPRGSIYWAERAERLFGLVQPFEEKYHTDLCAMTQAQLQETLGAIFTFGTKRKYEYSGIAHKYIKFCIADGVEGAADHFKKLGLVGVDSVRVSMVSGPLQLERYLDTVFPPVSEETPDVLARCYLWLAFMGVRHDDVLAIRTADVDLAERCVRYRGTALPICLEALPAFTKAATLQDLCYKHPLYHEDIRRKRVDGDLLFRSVRAALDHDTFRCRIGHAARGNEQMAGFSKAFLYDNVFRSGLFYRMYERERAGYPVNFGEVALSDAYEREPDFDPDTKSGRARLRVRANYYNTDYQRWKQAFAVS